MRQIVAVTCSPSPSRGQLRRQIGSLLYERTGLSTNKKAVIQKAETSSLDSQQQPPFTAIGDPERLFGESELEDLLELTRSVAA